MAKKCVYCRNDIADNRAVDVCDRCGVGVWGYKMFKAIIEGMDNAREKGDLMQGSVFSESGSPPKAHKLG
jgi:hypothetical protein